MSMPWFVQNIPRHVCQLILLLILWISVSTIYKQRGTVSTYYEVDNAVRKQVPGNLKIVTQRTSNIGTGVLKSNPLNASQDDPDLIKLIRDQWLQSPSLQKQLVSDKKDYSEYRQSTYIDKLLHEKKKGVYVECGAADGVTSSNSLFFEKYREWSGILIEANPTLYKQMIKIRRHAHTIHACLSTEPRPTKVQFMSAGLLSGIVGKMQKEHARFVNKLKQSKAVAVQCFPLFSILQAAGVNHVDYFALDVEGAEIDILKTIPFDKITIDVIMVEFGVYDGRVNKKLGENYLVKLKEYFKSLNIYKEVGKVGPVDFVWRRKE